MKLKIFMTLGEWEATCDVLTCKWCDASLRDVEFDQYKHPNGWYVEGTWDRQWLSKQCPVCGYEWSLAKLQSDATRSRLLDLEKKYTLTGKEW